MTPPQSSKPTTGSDPNLSAQSVQDAINSLRQRLNSDLTEKMSIEARISTWRTALASLTGEVKP